MGAQNLNFLQKWPNLRIWEFFPGGFYPVTVGRMSEDYTEDKCMAWTGIVNGKCLPVLWFEGSVNSEVYLKVLKEALWPAVRAVATMKQYLYQ